MARGYPDYGNPFYTYGTPWIDPGVLFLGAFGFLPSDTTAHVIYADNFRYGVRAWSLSHDGDAVDPFTQDICVEVPPMTVELESGTIAGGGVSRIKRYINVAEPIAAGVEIGYRSNANRVDIYMYLKFGINQPGRIGCVRFSTFLSGNAQVYTGGAWVVIPGIQYRGDGTQFMTFKLSCDFIAGKYIKFMYANTDFDLSAYTLDLDPTADDLPLLVTLEGHPASPADYSGFLGHVLVTADENLS